MAKVYNETIMYCMTLFMTCFSVCSKWLKPFVGLVFVSLIVGALLSPVVFQVAGAEKPLNPNKRYTFHLTNDRVCEKCAWRWAGPDEVEFTSRDGVKGTYNSREILSVDTSPVLSKLLSKSIHGVGLPGRILVPKAFDDEKHLR